MPNAMDARNNATVSLYACSEENILIPSFAEAIQNTTSAIAPSIPETAAMPCKSGDHFIMFMCY